MSEERLKNKSMTKGFKLLLIFFITITILSWIAYLSDVSRIKSGKNSLFTYPFSYYKDGGSVYRVGVGYGVFQWNKMADKSINGMEIHGYLIGTEIIPFPECYLNIINRRTPEPKIQLDFIPNIK